MESEDAFAVIRIPDGGYKWQEEALKYTAVTGGKRQSPPGKILLLNKEFAPVILEVMEKSVAGSMEAFEKKVNASVPLIKKNILSYQTIYGDTISFDTSFKKVPEVNGRAVNFEPEKVYDSPFLQSIYNSGVVSIQKGERKRVLDFNKLTAVDVNR